MSDEILRCETCGSELATDGVYIRLEHHDDSSHTAHTMVGDYIEAELSRQLAEGKTWTILDDIDAASHAALIGSGDAKPRGIVSSIE